MPKYFFHVTDGKLFLNDDFGSVWATLRDAQAQAIAVARQLARDDYAGFVVRVVNDKGAIVAEVPIAQDAPKNSGK
jgi:hypothetical protein